MKYGGKKWYVKSKATVFWATNKRLSQWFRLSCSDGICNRKKKTECETKYQSTSPSERLTSLIFLLNLWTNKEKYAAASLASFTSNVGSKMLHLLLIRNVRGWFLEMDYDQEKGDRSVLNSLEQIGLVECYMNSSTYCVHSVPYTEQRALQLKNIIELLVMAYALFSDKCHLFCTYSG